MEALAPLDPENARRALDEACASVGLDATDADLIRLGENAMFRLKSVPIIGRVARSEEHWQRAEREVQVSRWLAGTDVDGVRALAVEQPVKAAGRVVTLWESVSEQVEYGTAIELAVLLRRLHALDAPEWLELPTLDPYARTAARLAAATAIADADLRYLHETLQRLTAAYGELTFALPQGVIHGDANVGNVFRDDAGRPVLGDFDTFAIGPREWDLIQTALFYDRFGWHTEDEYRSFVEIYGFDVMAWSGYEVLADSRELMMVSWLSQNAADPDAAAEVSKRVYAMQSGGTRRDWKPF